MVFDLIFAAPPNWLYPVMISPLVTIYSREWQISIALGVIDALGEGGGGVHWMKANMADNGIVMSWIGLGV